MTVGGHGSGRDPVDATAELERLRAEGRDGPLDKMAAVKHGLRMQGRAFYPCKRCLWRENCDRADESEDGTCIIEREVFEARVREIMALPQIEPIDQPRVARAVMDEIRSAVGEAYLRAQGEFRVEDGEIRYAAAAAEVRRMKQRADDALDALGIGPVARRKLDVKEEGGGLAAAILALEAEERREREARRRQAADAAFADEEEADAPAGDEPGAWAWREE